MAEPVVIEARLRDELTRPLRAARAELERAEIAARRLGVTSGGSASAGLTRMEAAAKRLQRAASTANVHLRAMSAWVGRELVQAARRGAIGLALVVTAIAGFGLKAASNFQQARIAFDTLLGSADKGKALFDQLQKINLTTPFQLGEIAPATQLLLRYGVAGERVVPVLKSLLDAAALSGEPAANLSKLSLAVGQVVQKGKLEGQEARQLAEAGIDAYGLMAAKLGTTRAEAIKLGEAGKLSSEVFLEGIQNLDGPLAKLRGGAEKMSQTLMGQLSNLKDAINVRLADAASPLVTQLTAQIPAITAAVGSAVDAVGPPVFRLVGLLAEGLARVLPIIAPLLAIVVDQLGRLMTAAAPGLKALEPLGGEIGRALVELVDALVPVMPDLVALFIALVQVLPVFIRLLADLVPLVSPMARLATALLSFDPVRNVMAGLLAVLIGYRALSGIASSVWAFATAIRGVAAAQTEANVATAAGGGGLSGRTALGIGAIGAGGAGVVIGAPGATSGQSAGADLAFVGSGALLGAGIGSVVPVVGTGVGAAAGGVLAGGFVGARRLFEAFSGDVDSNLARSSRVHAAAAGATPGRSRITSTLRGFGVTGPGSGHVRGTAWDAAPDFPQAYAANIRRLGGFAAIHDQGSGRHVHAQIGDTTPVPGTTSSGGDGLPPIIVHVGNVWGQVDLEAAVARGTASGIDRHRRRQIERGHVNRTGGG